MHEPLPLQTLATSIRAPHNRWVWPGVLLLGLTVFAVRLAAPPNLLDQDQENPAAYVLDAVQNGHWLLQHDLLGEISSKPPVYTWLAALVTLAFGRISLFSLYLPGALALIGTAWLIFTFGRERFGERVGAIAAVACFLSIAGWKQFGLARTDGVFAFAVTATALLGYRAWTLGTGWTWFWLAGAMATLTKGPLGLVLGALGLVAVCWERRSGEARPLRGSHVAGIALFVLVTLGWLGLALAQFGRSVWDKLFIQELVFHVVEGEQKKAPGTLFYLSPLYYLARAAPWSLFGYLGLWRIWTRPATGNETRRSERFLFCWFIFGLLLFSMAPHQRGDLLWPIMPAGALIGAIELARLTGNMCNTVFYRRLAILSVAGAIGFSLYFFLPRAKHLLIQQTIVLRSLAQRLREQGGEQFPLTHTDDPEGLQVYLNTYRPSVSFERAAALLRSPEAVFVAVSDWSRLNAMRQPADPPAYTLLDDEGPVPKLRTRIVSNRRQLKLNELVRFAEGPWLIRYNARLVRAAGNRFVFSPGAQAGEVVVVNEGKQAQKLSLAIEDQGRVTRSDSVLAPGQATTLRVP